MITNNKNTAFKRFLRKVKIITALALCPLIAMPAAIVPAQAARGGGDRTLHITFTHTGETKQITFRRNGKYVASGIKELSWLLRDWRRKEATKMDPRLFDLVWSVYQESGATGPIKAVSGYRSLKTNNMLRSRSRGVAKNSQHTRGKAMDFYIPGVSVKKLREIGLKMQIGGVGYYPGSRTPFVHMDTGSVRHWPRMTTKQLLAVFPTGETLHTPTNRKKQKRYDVALAKYNASKNEVIQPLSARGSRGNGGNTLIARIFNNDNSSKQKRKAAPAPKIPAAAIAEAKSRPTRQQTRTKVAIIPLPQPAARAPAAKLVEPVATPTTTVAAIVPLPVNRPKSATAVEVEAPIQVAAVETETAPLPKPAVREVTEPTITLAQAPLPKPAPQGLVLARAQTNQVPSGQRNVIDPTTLVLANASAIPTPRRNLITSAYAPSNQTKQYNESSVANLISNVTEPQTTGDIVSERFVKMPSNLNLKQKMMATLMKRRAKLLRNKRTGEAEKKLQAAKQSNVASTTKPKKWADPLATMTYSATAHKEMVYVTAEKTVRETLYTELSLKKSDIGTELLFAPTKSYKASFSQYRGSDRPHTVLHGKAITRVETVSFEAQQYVQLSLLK